jgi:hypothetical protein
MDKPIFAAFILFLISLASCKKEENKTTADIKTRTRLVSFQQQYGANQIAVTRYFWYNSDNKLSTLTSVHPRYDTTKPVRIDTTQYFYGSNNRLSTDKTIYEGTVFHGSYDYDNSGRLIRYQYKDGNGKLWFSLEYKYNTDFIEIRWKRDPNTNRVDTVKYYDDGFGNIASVQERNNRGEYKKSMFNTTYDNHPFVLSTVPGLEIIIFVENNVLPAWVIPKNNISGYSTELSINNDTTTYNFGYVYNDEGYVTQRMLGGGLPLGGMDVFTYEKY